MRQADVVLIHPPSVFDFRERAIAFGPISAVIPSTPIFEMYPVGFLTLAAYLRRRGYRVRIVNLALLMMRSRRFDPEKFLRRLEPKLFGIDLHWLPHVHGATELASMLKRLHPEIPTVFGGISATYFHEELIRDPAVDYVLRGSVTEPALLELVRALEHRARLSSVPGLTWKSAGQIQVNNASLAPQTLDEFPIELGGMIADVIKRFDFWSSIPFQSFWQHPITAVFTTRGCARGCVTCGGSRNAFRRFMPGVHPIHRSPAAIAESVRHIATMSRAPIFFVGDLRGGGRSYARSVLRELSKTKVRNRLIFEFFDPPPETFIEDIDRCVAHWGAELSPESHDPAIRATLGKGHFTNDEMNASIATMLAHRCEQLDVFYMTGLPGQTYDNAIDMADSIEPLLAEFDSRVNAYITPMAPFLDPGSDLFENPERYGYRLLARTLAEHKALLERCDWPSMLNYETEWMTRDELARATCDATARLDELKECFGRRNELFPRRSLLHNFRLGGILKLLFDELRPSSRTPIAHRERHWAV